MRRASKGLAFYPVMTIVVLIVLIYAYGQVDKLKSSYTGALTKDIGSTQAELFKTYQSGEEVLFYIDTAAKSSVQQAAVEFAQSGAVLAATCGTVLIDDMAYTQWNAPAQECFPLNPYPEFEQAFTKSMNVYIEQYTHPIISLPKDNYALTLTKKEIIGNAIEDIQIDVKGPNEAWLGRYYANPSFTVNNPLDLQKIKDTASLAKEIYLLCIDAACAKQEITDRTLGWQLQEQGTSLLIDVPLGTSVWATVDETYAYQPITLKFALDFS